MWNGCRNTDKDILKAMNKDTQRKMLQTKYLFILQHDETGRTTEQVFSLKEIYNGDAKGFINDTPRYYLVDIRQINT